MRPAIWNPWAVALLLSALMAALLVTPAIAATGNNPDVGRVSGGVAAMPAADFGAEWALASAVVRKPDGRIRLGAWGWPGEIKRNKAPFVGNNVYNTTGAHQTDVEKFEGTPTVGSYLAFEISIQNDGSRADRFKVKATGLTYFYPVKYFHGTTNITSAVVAGTYRTASLAPGATYLITAKVEPGGGSMTRRVTITSIADAAKKDAVKFGLKEIACEC